VLQGIAARGAFRRLDYLSTVSGGGYAGAALTWFLRSGGGQFPFATSTPGSPLDFIRRHASYLVPAPRLTLLSLAAVVFQQMAISVFVYGALLIGFFFALNAVDAAARPVKAILGLYVDEPVIDFLLPATNVTMLVVLALAAAFVLSAAWTTLRAFSHHLRRVAPDVQRHAYALRLRAQRRATRLLRWTIVAGVIASVPVVSLLLEQWIGAAWARGAFLGTVSTLVGLLASIGRRRAADAQEAGSRPILRAIAVQTAVLVAVYGFLLFSDTMAVVIARSAAVWSIFVLVGAGLALGLAADLNAHGSHRVYRDRLMETFLPDQAAVDHGTWRPAWGATGFPLHACCDDTTAGPYHLLNASLVTVSSEDARLRVRGADSFVLSPLYCGSPATGWEATEAWQRGTMTLVAATAISAAAADPHAAAAGRGPTRGALLSLLLAVLNLRLGYAARNPDPRRGLRRFFLPPNLITPGIRQNLLGAGLSETRPYVELADGGDFDNLGIYELVRRRVDVIVAADASQDATMGFASLGDVVERVRVDFGATIAFEDPERDLSGLLHGSAGLDLASRTYELTRRAWAIGRVHYPGRDGEPEKDGLLLYLKATLFADVPVDVLAYKAEHPSFPHQSTFDQLFDESMFEAYRGLGEAAALELLADDGARVALGLFRPERPPEPAPLRIVDPSRP
jgi:hypothetical protein